MTRTDERVARRLKRWHLGTSAMLLVIVVASFVTGASTSFTDPLWMAREGMALLHGGPVSHPDTWGWSPVLGNFVPTAPGWQIYLGLGTLVLGPLGVTLSGVVAIAASLGGLAWVARRLGASTAAISVAFIGLWGLQGALASRAALPALVLWMVDATWLLPAIARSTTQMSRMPWRLGLVQAGVTALGLWMHASWVVFAPATALGLLAWSAIPQPMRWRRRLTTVVWPCAGTMVAMLAGPAGIHAWSDAARVQAQGAGLIVEWSAFPLQTTFWKLALVAVALSSSLIAVMSVRRSQLWHASPVLVLALATIASALASFMALRFMFQAAVLATPLLALLIERMWQRVGRHRPADYRLGPLYISRILAAAFAVLLPWAALQTQSSPAVAPSRVIAVLPTGCRLFSDYAIANETILLRPDVPVWLDGRLDYWGRTRIASYIGYMGGSNPNSPVPQGTSCVAVTSDEASLTRALAASHQWRETRRLSDVSLWLPTNA